MELAEALRRRRMVRTYDPARPVPRDLVDAVITAGLRAPSAGSSQGWHFLVLSTPAERAAYWATTTVADSSDAWLAGMRTAPVLILVFSDRAAYERRYARPDKAAGTHAPVDLDHRWPVPYWHIDAGMATMLVLLAAVDAGLGACWFGVPTDRVAAVRDRFEVPGGFVPVGAISLGYEARPAPGSPRRHRPIKHRPWSEVVSYGRIGYPTTGSASVARSESGNSDSDGSDSDAG